MLFNRINHNILKIDYFSYKGVNPTKVIDLKFVIKNVEKHSRKLFINYDLS